MFLLSGAAIFLLFQLVASGLRKLPYLSSYLIACLVTIPILLYTRPADLFAFNVLIELPLKVAYLSLLTAIFHFSSKQLGWREVAYLSIFTAGSYILKKPLIISVVPVILLITLDGFKLPGTAARKFSQTILKIIFSLLLPLGIKFLWDYEVREFTDQWTQPSKVTSVGIWEIIQSPESKEVRGLMWDKVWEFGRLTKLQIVFFLFSVTAGLFSPKFRKLSLISTAPFVLYIGGLYWVYTTAFGDYERSYLASYERYIKVLLQPSVAFFATVWAQNLLFYVEKFSPSLAPRKNILRLGTFAALGFLLLLTPQRSNLVSATQFSRDEILATQLPSIYSLIEDQFEDRPPRVLLVDQGGDGYAYMRALYGRITRGLKEKYRLQHYSWSFTVKEVNNVWAKRLSEKEMTNLIMSQNIIWTHKVDPWISRIMTSLVVERCRENRVAEYYFFRLEGERFFDCIHK